jgi:mannose/fructose-specific phosphotransferase system component IIA
MSDAVGIVVTHGRLGGAMVEAAEEISGIHGGLVAISNEGVSPEELRLHLQAATVGRRVILFADLASGSCAFACRSMAMVSPDVAVVTGVSLPMLIDFLFHRDLAVPELAERLVEKGRAGARAYLAHSEDDGPGSLSH